jgi:hypothetical protein
MKLPIRCGLGAAACSTGVFTYPPGGNQPLSLDRGASDTPLIGDGPRQLAFDRSHNGQPSIYVWSGP